jgi:Ca-activated chloride channel family protein
MNKYPMNEDDLKKLLQQQPPVADQDTKARHLAAAMAAFQAQQQQEPEAEAEAEAEATAENIANEKDSNILQGFLQRLRLTRDTNQRGNHTMNKSMNSSTDKNNFDNRPFWQKPVLMSGIAASSLAVLAGLTFMQHLTVDSDHEALTTGIASQSMIKNAPQAEAEIQSEAAGASATNDTAEYAKQVAQAKREQLARGKVAYAAKPSVAAGMRNMTQPAPAYAAEEMVVQQPQQFRDRFENVKENAVTAVADNPLSTFSIDVDTASYSFVRRLLNNGQLPVKDAVRSEEMINYFDYRYPQPKNRNTPFSTSVTVVDSPWAKGNKLIHIGIQGYQLAASEIPQSNLVFLLDVSGSMEDPTKLPLVKQSMSLLIDSLKPDDTIAIAVYAGAAGTVLEPTPVKEKSKILSALNHLQAGGSTAGAEGIALAYQLAEANFNQNGVNRIILATDGDFNVGQTNDDALRDLVERKREKGIYLSVLGFGQGNYQDALMQTLAQNGNGTAAYIDTLSEAQKVLVTEATSNLFPIAQDVKIQVEFNPATVKEYRLIGYETRALNREDFNNDKVDAGEIGAGQRVTAIYEITPTDTSGGLLNESRYQPGTKKEAASSSTSEYAFLRLRYKLPNEKKSNLIETPIGKNTQSDTNADYKQEVNFSIAVAGFTQLLRGSNYAGTFNYDKVIELAQANKGADEYGYRTEFVQLVRKAKIAH